MKMTSTAVIVRGVLTVIFGILAMAWPISTVVALAVLWGVYALVDGLMSFGIAFSHRVSGWVRALYVFLGVVGIVAGLVVIFRPISGALILTWVLGIWLMVHGILEVASAFGSDTTMPKWLMVVTGLLALIAGILVAANPGRAVISITVWMGVFAVLWGITTIAAGASLRKLERESAETPPAATPPAATPTA